MLDMLADVSFTGVKQLHHLRLCQPYRLILQLHVKLGLAVFGLVDDDFVLEFLLFHSGLFLSATKVQYNFDINCLSLNILFILNLPGQAGLVLRLQSGARSSSG